MPIHSRAASQVSQTQTRKTMTLPTNTRDEQVLRPCNMCHTWCTQSAAGAQTVTLPTGTRHESAPDRLSRARQSSKRLRALPNARVRSLPCLRTLPNARASVRSLPRLRALEYYLRLRAPQHPCARVRYTSRACVRSTTRACVRRSTRGCVR